MSAHAPRPYQLNLINSIYASWAGGNRNVLAVLPTGGGKTFVFSVIAAAFPGAVCAIAHRSELVVQMSVALAREGVVHRVIGPASLRRAVTRAHLREFNRSFYDPNARVAVASVDTLVNADPADPWFAQVVLWIQDEAHHVLASNKWGRACELFPNARGLGVTATPLRADGKGLGRHADGLFDDLIVGPSMRGLIDQGYLAPYKVYAPKSDIQLANVRITESGDYSPVELRKARRESHITGDVVQTYLRIAPGLQGITFDVDVESATETAAAYRAAGVSAEVVSAKTPTELRDSIIQRFKAGEILQLVNVDLFGEGFDVPAVRVVSFARPTESYGLYVQQFGRALRILAGKSHGIIIDHVGNIVRHLLPDSPKVWTLDRRERRSAKKLDDVVPLRSCLNEECMQVYERVLKCCPFCGHTPEPAGRSTPEMVEGDLIELDAAVLARLRGEVSRVDGDPVFPYGAAFNVKAAVGRRHEERQGAQKTLRQAMALWAGWQSHQGRPDAEAQKRFWFKFGIDVLSAQTLGATDAGALEGRVVSDLLLNNVVQLGADQ